MKKYICPNMKVIELAQEELICTSSVDETGLGTGYAPNHVKGHRFYDEEED